MRITLNLRSDADLPLLTLASSAAGPPLNAIFRLTDDPGNSDVGCCGVEKVRIPHIDQFAAAGIWSPDFYTAAPLPFSPAEPVAHR